MGNLKISLASARVNKGLTATDVAKKMGKTQGWLSLIETGVRRIYADDLFKLCDIYDISILNIFLPKKPTKSNKRKQKVKKSIKK